MEVKPSASRGRRAWRTGIVALAAAWGSATAGASYEIWITTAAHRVLVVEHATFAVVATIDLTDTAVTEPPSCVAFSTTPAHPLHAFVTHGRYVKPIVAAPRLVLPPRDVAVHAGIPGLLLRACAASVTRTFETTGGVLVDRNYLLVSGDDPTGRVWAVVLDQDRLITGLGSPVVAAVPLFAGGSALDVDVFEAPRGAAFLRARFAVSRLAPPLGQEIVSVPFSLPIEEGAPPSIGPPSVVVSPTFSSPLARAGSPHDRELAVVPGWAAGILSAPEFRRSCDLGPDLAAAFVCGPGPDSYTLGVTRWPDELLLVDPGSCESRAIGVGSEPSAVVPLSAIEWHGAYVANRGSGDLTFVHRDGATSFLPLGTGNSPVGLGITDQPACIATNLRIALFAHDVDGVPNDVALTWEENCADPDQEFTVWCACFDDDPDCDCGCDCEAEPPPPDCECPVLAEAPAAIGDFLVQFPPTVLPSLNPWKKLESSADTTYVHVNEGKTPPSYAYAVTTTQDPPPAPPP